MFAIGSLGCLCFPAMIGIVVVFKDIRSHSRYLNHIFTVLLVLWVCYTLVALLYPIIRENGPISMSPNSFIVCKT